MSAKYILRLDDACPTMDHPKWHRLEEMFDRLGVRPIVAVVPDNQDPELMACPPDPRFWQRARGWQDKGWAIGLHGYRHEVLPYAGPQYIPMHPRSEFAGNSLDAQIAKIASGWAILNGKGLVPTVWVAPAHSFDRTTVEALRAATPLRTISDGLATDRFERDGFRWIPQQLWSLKEKKRGLWTVCLHPNSMTDAGFAELEALLSGPYRDRLVSLAEVSGEPRRLSLEDRLEALDFWRRHHWQRFLMKVKVLVGR